MSQVDLDKLTKPFPPSAVKQRQVGGGRSLSYVEGHAVIHRLNDATQNIWDLEVKEIDSRAFGKPNDRGVQPMLMTARVALTLPGLGTREGIGVQVYYEGTGEDLVKGAVTDALKKAATLFGVGLELYGADYEGEDVAPETRAAANRREAPQQPPRPAPAPQSPAPARTQAPAPPQAPSRGGPTDKQIRYMFGLAQKVNLDREVSHEDFLHGQIYGRWGVSSLHDLTAKQASDFIGYLQNGDLVDAVMPPTGRRDPVEAREQGALVGMPEEPAYLRGVDPWS